MECMRLSHAGLVVTQDNETLIVDPGNFSNEEEIRAALSLVTSPTALVITHEHADHWTPDGVRLIRAVAPDCPIFTTPATAQALTGEGIENVTTVQHGSVHSVGAFTLSFYGGRHEKIHASIPLIENVGVNINDTLAYGGDSLMRPPFETEVLGIPIGSPWSNVSQVMDFVLDSRPKRAYLTHDGMLSARGRALFTTQVSNCLAKIGGELIELPHVSTSPTHGLILSK